MSGTAETAPSQRQAGSRWRGLTEQVHHNPKRDLLIAWFTTLAFYQIFAIVMFMMTRTQPPPSPTLTTEQQVAWFDDMRYLLLIGFAIMFVVTGMTAMSNSLIAYSMRRMSVSRAFAYSYLVLYSLAAVPGSLLLCIVLTVAAMRPDRDPLWQTWLYDLAFLSYVGTMGVFLIGSLIWMLAILLDKNRVFPKWFAYLNLCNALTEVVVSPAWIFDRGVFAWNGLISWWVDMVVFGIYTGVFISLLRKLADREDLGTGPLPDLPSTHDKSDVSSPARTPS